MNLYNLTRLTSFIICVLVFFFFMPPVLGVEPESGSKEIFIRLTGGPIFYEPFYGKDLNLKKWDIWSKSIWHEGQEEYDNLSYQISQDGLTLFSKINCLSRGNNYYGVTTKLGRGLVDLTLVSEIDVFNTLDLPILVHLCNCCDEFYGRKYTALTSDDFWYEVEINKRPSATFRSVRLGKNTEVITKSSGITFKVINNTSKKDVNKKHETGFETYLVKLTQSIPSYVIRGYIRTLDSKSDYVFVGSTKHPSPLSQVQLELKTDIPQCREKQTRTPFPTRVGRFRHLRLYKNPKHNPLFVRLINKEGLPISNYKIVFEVKDIQNNKKHLVSGITDRDGYASLDLSNLQIKEYPIIDFHISVFKNGNAKSIISKELKFHSLADGIYPGDFWQLHCKGCI